MKIIKEISSYLIIIVVVVFIRAFIVTPVMIDGESMDPTLKETDIVILNKLDHKYERGDIVVVKTMDERIIKRVIGLPGERIRCADNVIYINGKKIDDDFAYITADFPETYIKKDYYYVLGDNRENSLDSRRIGAISKSQIVGSVDLIIFPFTRFGFID